MSPFIKGECGFRRTSRPVPIFFQTTMRAFWPMLIYSTYIQLLLSAYCVYLEYKFWTTKVLFRMWSSLGGAVLGWPHCLGRWRLMVPSGLSGYTAGFSYMVSWIQNSSVNLCQHVCSPGTEICHWSRRDIIQRQRASCEAEKGLWWAVPGSLVLSLSSAMLDPLWVQKPSRCKIF